MAEAITKPKLQVRTQTSFNGAGDKNPSPGAKLLINHGKPNFTIQRSPKTQENGEGNPLSANPQSKANNNYYPYKTAATVNSDIVVKSTKFNGAFKPSSVPVSDKQPHQQTASENEAAKVVLRRAKVAEPPIKDGEDENVPEFIRRQRRIQERLAKENVLDFENRRSGYFTHVMISPTSPNRTSFVETMSSPAVVPSLEMPVAQHKREATVIEEAATNGHTNGHEHEHEHEHVEEEEVNRAIDEVNKAVAGEEEDKSADVEHHEYHEQHEHHEHHEQHVAVTTHEHHEHETTVTTTTHEHIESAVVATTHERIESAVVTTTQDHIESAVATTTHEHIEAHDHVEAHVEAPTTLPHFEEPVATVVAVEPIEQPIKNEWHPIERKDSEEETTTEHVEAHVIENGHSDAPKENGHHATNGGETITISHTNGSDGPSIPSPDPSGALGVNYEPKTVVSFSQELGSEINKYPDTVKVTKEGESAPIDPAVQDLAKLKFDIKTDDQDVQVTPVLRTE